MPYLRSGLIPPFRSTVLLFGVLSPMAIAGQGQAHKASVPAKNNAPALKAAGQALPLVFEENAGQLPAGSAFAGRTRNYSVQVSPAELRFGLSGKSGMRTVSLAFSGSKDAKAEGVSDAGFRTNIYLGNDPRAWHTGIRNYNRVALRHLYPGVDAEFYSRGQEIEHDFFVAPGADAAQLAMRVAGAKATTLSPEGDLLLTAEEGALRLRKPIAYQVLADGSHHNVEAAFTLAQAGPDKDAAYSLGFQLGAYDHSRTLVIDPVITYATYMAGASGATPVAMTLDTSGDVYLTGSTTSDIATFRGVTLTPAPVTGFTPTVPAAHTLTFVAQLLANANGSRLNWLTYYGSNSADVVPTAIALAPNTSPTTAGAKVYFAGNTLTGTLPGTAGAAQATITGAQAGYIAALNLSTGTAAAAPFTTYVDGSSSATQKTAIGALAVDTSGNVTAAGSSVGTAYGTAALDVSSPFCSIAAYGSATPFPRGLIATVSGTLTSRVYSTYVCGSKAANNANDFYSLTGVAVAIASPATSPTTYYISGTTSLDFPKNGVYAVGGYYPNSIGGSTAFAAALSTTLPPLTVATSFWSAGSGKDVANGLALDSTGNLYVFGKTTSTDLATNALVNGTPAPANSGLSQTYPAPTGAGSAGFVANISSANALTGITYLSGPLADTAKTSSVNAAVVDSNGAAVYLTGNTDEPEASFPLGASATTPSLPYSTTDPTLSQDVSDPTAGVKRAFLLSMPPALTTLNYRAYFAPQAGTSSGVAVAYGNATTNSNSGGAGTAATLPFAFVLSSEQSTLPSYTTASAADQQPPATATQTAYLAQVAYSRLLGTTTPVLSATTKSASPNPVGYSTAYPAAQSTLTATWTLASVAGADAPSSVVFNLPQSPYLATYTAGALTISGTEGTCTLGPNVNPPPAKIAGFTCIIPQIAVAPGGTVTFTLVEPVTNAINSAGGSFNIPAAAFDAQGDALNLTTNNVSVAAIPQFTLTNSVNPLVVNAARDNADYGTGKTANTQVTYSYTVTNTNNVASTGVVITTNLNTTTPGTSNYLTVTGTPNVLINGVAAACDPTSAAGCAIPANGVLTYSITGIYLGNQFPGNQNGQFAVSTTGPQITFPALGSSVTVPSTSAAAGAVTVEVNGISVIKLDAITYGTYTYTSQSLAGAPAANSFQLGDAVTLTATVENTGPNQAPSYNVTIYLPLGFVVTTTPSGCTYTAATNAAVGNLACALSNIPGTGATSTSGKATISIVGMYKDTGSESTGNDADAVAAPKYSSTAPTAAQVQTSPTFGSSATYFTGSPSSQLATNVIVATGDSPKVTINATRVNSLTLGVNVATPLGTSTINEKSPLDGMVLSAANPPLNDALNYTVTVTNMGKSVARGLFFTVPLPSLGSLGSSTLAVTGVTSSSPAQLACSYSATIAAVVCYETDLMSTGGVPPTPITLPSPPSNTAQTYTVTFTTSYSEASIGLHATPPTTTVTQGGNSFYAAADTYNPTNGVAGALALNGTAPTGGSTVSLTLQRQSTLIKTLTFTPFNASPTLTNYLDTAHINLNEGAAGPGNNDTIIVRSQTYNAGPNDAADVVITLPLPPYMVVGVPTGCTLTQTAGGTPLSGPVLITAGTGLTGSGGATMTCNVPSSTTPAGTATGQLTASISACAASADPASASMISFDNKCFSVAFYAKFIDAPSDITIVGANPNAAVTYSPQTSVENDIDTNVTTNSTFTAAPVVQIVQRAAHVRLYAAVPSPTYTDSALTVLPKDSVSGYPETAQAAALTTKTGNVYNCLRYAITVVNDGPNYANHSVLSYSHSAGVFVPTQIGRGTPTAVSSVNCPVTASIAATDIGAVGPGAGSRATVYVDGFFNTGSLTTTNSATTTFQTGKFIGAGYNESNTSFAETGNALVPDYSSSQRLTIVNTPLNDSNTLDFTIQPINTATPTAPVVTLVFHSVSAPGITAAFTSATTSCSSSSAVYNTCYPYGSSPVPSDLVPTRNLYQPGAHPLFYQLPSTATVPNIAGNTTSVCLQAATTFPDIFVKPERVLLWVLTNATNTTTYNSFPSNAISPTAPKFASTGSLAGDVTRSVLPYGSATYLQLPTQITFAQVPQAQPATVCGAVNGLTKTNTADSASVTAAQTFGLLEPVNFAPVVVAGAVPQSNTVSKGSTSALSDIYLNRSVVAGGVLSKANTYDYDDRDPCYIASNTTTPRQNCDDNPYLYAVVFTGGHGNVAMTSPARITSLTAETAAAAPANSYNLLNSINLGVNNAVYVAVADQAVGADVFNTDISSAVGYSGNPAFTSLAGNPFYQQGNFLLQSYSPSNTAASPLVCDPGSAYLDYAVSATTVCRTSTGVDKGVFTGTGSGARYIRGGAKDPAVAIDYNQATGINGRFYDLSNVGAVGVTVSGLTGSGLIALQQPGDPAIATATVTAGQTAGFYWPWLFNATTAGLQYDLTCAVVDSSGNAATLPAGVSCNISTVTPASATASSTVYTRGVSVDTSSTAPTIFVVTANGTLYAGVTTPAWKKGLELAGLAMLLPVLFFRRRLGKGAALAMVLLGLAAAPLLSGCGSGSSIGGTVNGVVTPAGTYYFRVTATQQGTTNKITSDPFKVIVQKGS